jgi:tripartite-type tricarboxylate transporter receptor subunit TctC
MKKFILSILMAVFFGGVAEAQTYPSKPIRIVVGYSAGGGNDLIARIIAVKLQDKLGQPVVVDNKPGAQSIIAAELVAKSPPDGYTLLIAPSGPLTINPAVFSKLPYNPEKDFAPISMLATFPLIMVVGADTPIRSMSELVAYGKANPEKANYAASATPFQLVTELFNQRTNSKFQYIPYRGSGESVQSVANGEVLMTVSDLGPAAAPLRAGRVRGLAIALSRRHPMFPDVPTMAEAGINNLDVSLWTGLVAPAGTPAPIIARLNTSIHEALAMPDVQQALQNIAVEAHHTSPDEFRTTIIRDTLRWKNVAATANIKLE